MVLCMEQFPPHVCCGPVAKNRTRPVYHHCRNVKQIYHIFGRFLRETSLFFWISEKSHLPYCFSDILVIYWLQQGAFGLLRHATACLTHLEHHTEQQEKRVSMKPFLDKDFLLTSDAAKDTVSRACGAYAHCRLPLPHQPGRDRGRPPLHVHYRRVAGRRPLQVARHALRRRAGAPGDRRRRPGGQVPRLGGDGAEAHRQSALSLDASGAATVFRH